MSENEQHPPEPATDAAFNEISPSGPPSSPPLGHGDTIAESQGEQASPPDADSTQYSEAALNHQSRSSFMPDSPPEAGTPVVDPDVPPLDLLSETNDQHYNGMFNGIDAYGIGSFEINDQPSNGSETIELFPTLPDRRILWEPSTGSGNEGLLEQQTDSQRRVTFSRHVDILYPPQTPTHTPILSPEPAGGALDLDSRIARLDLAANRTATGHDDREEHQVAGADRDQTPEGNGSSGPQHLRHQDLNLVPGNGEEQGGYEVGERVVVHLGPDHVSPETGSRINLTLPNPRDLPTYQLLMTVPYHAQGEPVRMEIDIPQHDARNEETNMLMFRVLSDDDGVDEEVLEPVNRRVTATPPPPHNDDFVVRRLQQIKAAESYMARLPSVETENLPEPYDRQCGICREDYGSVITDSGHHEHGPERAVRLPCNHVLGHDCLLRHLCGEPGQLGNTNCPMCRRELWAVDEGDEGEGQPMSALEYLRDTANQEPLQIPDYIQHANPPGWGHMRNRNQIISREAALLDELVPHYDRVRFTSYEEHQAALFEQLQRRGYLQPPHVAQTLVDIAHGREERILELLRGWGAHWHLSFGWMMNGRRMSGPRLNRAERREYVMYHMSTNVMHRMYGASPQLVGFFGHFLEPYARQEGLDFP